MYCPVSNFSVSQSSGKFLTDFSTFSDSFTISRSLSLFSFSKIPGSRTVKTSNNILLSFSKSKLSMLMDVLILMVYDKCPVDVSRLTWYGFDVLRSTMYGLYAVLVLIQHNAVSYRHPALHAYTHRAFFASKERPETFDVILSISSFEHHGLGRYGDPDPGGDLRSMKEAAQILLRGG